MSSSHKHALRIAVAAGGAALVAAVGIAPALAAEHDGHDDKALGKGHEHEMCEPVKDEDPPLPLLTSLPSPPPLSLPEHKAPTEKPGEDKGTDDCESDDGQLPPTTTTTVTPT